LTDLVGIPAVMHVVFYHAKGPVCDNMTSSTKPEVRIAYRIELRQHTRTCYNYFAPPPPREGCEMLW